MDPHNRIYMYMYGDKYSCTVIGNVWDCYDGDTVITYAQRPSFEESTSVKDIVDFYDYIPDYFDNILPTYLQKYDFKKLGEKTINGINVREFQGTIIDDGNQSHPSKAYTVNYNGEDIIVIAVSMENNDEMKEKMKYDLEYFMTHLKFKK